MLERDEFTLQEGKGVVIVGKVKELTTYFNNHSLGAMSLRKKVCRVECLNMGLISY